MFEDDEVLDSGGGGDDIGTIVLMLALYLIVLAFFILMNAISEDSKAKVDLALESVREGFSFRTEGQDMFDDNSGEVKQPVFDHISLKVHGILETYLSLRDFHFDSKDENMRIVMRPYSFFEPGSDLIKPQMAGFFDELAKVLADPEARVTFDVRVITRSVRSDAGQGEAAQTVDLEAFSGRRSSIFVRAFQARKVPLHSLAAASEQAGNIKRGEIEMRFKMTPKQGEDELDAALDFVRSLKNIQDGEGGRP